jgi:hypothetical protein
LARAKSATDHAQKCESADQRLCSDPSDGSLLDQYTRHEFQGRPLDGNFVVRIWAEDGVDFDSIKDVQLVLHYRYWTKFN